MLSCIIKRGITSTTSTIVRRCRAAGTTTTTTNHPPNTTSSSQTYNNNNNNNNNNYKKHYYSTINTTKIAERVERVLAIKSAAGLTYDDLATALGVTNTYAAQLLLGQAKLTPETAHKLHNALPHLQNEDIEAMQTDYPMRTYDEEILKEPNVYRTYEALMHNGEAIKSIINEQCGDGIMSAIDFYCDVGTTKGLVHGERRVVITLNGKFLPYSEQLAEHNGAKSPRE